MHSSILSSRAILPAVLLAVLLLLTAALFSAGFGYAGSGGQSQPWISNVTRVRDEIHAKRPDAGKPVIWITGGSNALFGIDSAVIERETGRTVRNYGLHAGLHPDLLFSQMIGKVKRGDLVVAAVEWEILERPLGNTFDVDTYLHHFSGSVTLSPQRKYRLLASVPLRRWLAGTWQFLSGSSLSYRAEFPAERLLSEWRQHEDKLVYSHTALNADGDLLQDKPLVRAAWVDDSSFEVPAPPGRAALARLAQWRSEFAAKGASLALVPPVMLESRPGKLTLPGTWVKIEAIRQALAKGGTPLNCPFTDSVFAAIYRFNTAYHLNAAGAALRSRQLGACIRRMLAGEMTETMPEAADAVRQRILEQKKDFGEGSMRFQKRLRNLALVRDALNAYHQQQGSYPGGKGGILPAELAPAFLMEMPTEPPASDAGVNTPRYFYDSDGKNFKLLLIYPGQDCTPVAANWPEMIDPARMAKGDPTDCKAFGYWTQAWAGR